MDSSKNQSQKIGDLQKLIDEQHLEIVGLKEHVKSLEKELNRERRLFFRNNDDNDATITNLYEQPNHKTLENIVTNCLHWTVAEYEMLHQFIDCRSDSSHSNVNKAVLKKASTDRNN